MSSGTASNDAIVKLERALPDLANGAHSLAEIEAWIRAQPCVRSVQLADYLLKSNPPQRDFIIDCADADGAPVRRILNVFVLGGQKFRFNGVRDP
jgi:hypothetical protein